MSERTSDVITGGEPETTKTSRKAAEAGKASSTSAIGEAAGFADVKLHGNLDGDGYGPSAERLVAVRRKPISRLMR
jgi:hypothetical protein